MRKYSTPPWRVDWDTNIASVKAANGIAVARCYQGDDDAVLIAAAPAMLEALQEIVRLQDTEAYDLQARDSMAALARAAIAKATK